MDMLWYVHTYLGVLQGEFQIEGIARIQAGSDQSMTNLEYKLM